MPASRREFANTLWVWVASRTGFVGRGRRRRRSTFWSASGSYLGVASHGATTSRSWQQLKLGQMAPRGTAFVRIELRQSGLGTSWWDDVALSDRSSAHRNQMTSAFLCTDVEGSTRLHELGDPRLTAMAPPV